MQLRCHISDTMPSVARADRDLMLVSTAALAARGPVTTERGRRSKGGSEMVLLRLLLLLLAAPAAVPSPPHQGLTLTTYNNGVLGGSPASTSVIPSVANVSLPVVVNAKPFSVEITGTVRLLRNESYEFSCAAAAAVTMLLLHVGDHLVCDRGALSDSMRQGPPVFALTADTLIFRMEIYGNGTAAIPAGSWVSVSWARGERSGNAAADGLKARQEIAPPAWAKDKPPNASGGAVNSIHGYTRWPTQNIDTVHNLPCPAPGCSEPPGVSDNSSQTLAGCIALCEALVAKGCVGFVSRRDDWVNGTENKTGLCYLRGTAPNCPSGDCKPRPSLPCASVFRPTESQSCGQAVWTRDETCKTGFVNHPPPKPFPESSCPRPPPPAPPMGPAESIPPARLLPELPRCETRRRAMQNQLRSSGWAHWYNMDSLRLVKLPEGISVRFGLCDAANCTAAQTLDGRRPSHVSIKAGVHAYDRSYSQLYFTDGRKGVNVSVEVSGGDDLHLRVTRIGVDSMHHYTQVQTEQATDASVTFFVEALSTWHFGNKLAILEGNALWLSCPGLSNSTLVELDGKASSGGNGTQFANLSAAHVTIDLSAAGTVARFSTINGQSASAFDAHLASVRDREVDTYAKFGAFARVAQATQAAVMWNLKYNPIEYGPFAPPGPWDFVTQGSLPDFGYTLFDWDNIFGSFMLGIGDSYSAKAAAYSSLIQIVKAKTTAGFVPNANTVTDRSEPPIGSKVLLELFKRHGDRWIVELLFDDLLDWSNWFLQARRLKPLGMIALGSVAGMDMARLESGCDDSPMYDGEFWSNKDSLMQLYDVGMTSMFTMEAFALSELADVIGRPESAMLRKRGASMQALISAHLWDDATHIFTNRFANGSFYRRISPTSFYAMLANASTDTQATLMVQHWMTNTSRFCVSTSGDMAGNNQAGCYWGMPSIAADDPAFTKDPQNLGGDGYWRGKVWAPMIQLTHWALLNYDHVPAVRAARKAMAKQATAMMMTQYDRNAHICENFSPQASATDCTGDTFYSWGALAGMVSLVEHGYF